ncbi:MAG: primosomal protein N' [Anaerolineae bacterium]|nr:primosomal protein N' [Anaerolineae bacterium]
MFVVVAVNAPAHGGGTAYRANPEAGAKGEFPGPVFHYHVPPEQTGQLTPGYLIEVPFGKKQVQGIVVSLSELAPVSETKPVTRVLFDGAVLSAAQIELGLWISECYFSPLIDCFRLMLPPGLLYRPRIMMRLHPGVPIPEGLPAAQQQVIELLQQHGKLSRTRIARRLGKDRADRAIRALIRQGVLIRGSDLPTPRARPKRANFVRLIASPPQVSGVRALLGHPSKQAAVLQALLDEDDPLPSVESILSFADASMSTISTLARKGWVTITAERTWVQPLPAADRIDLGQAPKQQAVLNYLLEQTAPVEENLLRRQTGASAVIVRALQERGAVQQIIEPAVVFLELSRRAAQEKVIELRGATGQHRVLDYLLTRSPSEWVWVSWVYAETGCRRDDLSVLEEHGVIEMAERQVLRDPLQGRTFEQVVRPQLTDEQVRAWGEIEPHLTIGRGASTFLLHGVTASGKTEIYMRAVERVLEQGRQAVVLVPEISLTPQAIRRFASRFSQALGVIHSGLSDGERYDTWRRIQAGKIRLVIGPRSALFAPLDDVGLIVLDEEHDASYKQSDTMPAYHARDVALRVAAIHGAVVLLGSATPDLGTAYRARERGDIHLLQLHKRILVGRQCHTGLPDTVKTAQAGMQFTEELPPVRVVDMRQELRVGNRSMFSRVLQKEMKRALGADEQMILFLNRRGTSTFVMCRDCGTVIRCPRCDISLTYHRSDERLICHHCNHQQPIPDVCPVCQSRRIRYFGVGTQRVEDAIRELLPDARILRWDRDATREKGSHETLLDQFASHQADVLIGTQMIAKGLDLPLVTLVGVITADTALNLPDFRAAERTFQLLVQVAGRAGRSLRGGSVVFQTYAPEHYAIQTAAHHDYDAFYKQECAFRQRLGYPPFNRLARLVYADSNSARCRQQSRALAEMLEATIRDDHLDQVNVIGPAPCFLSRLRGRWRWQIIVRADDPGVLFSRISLPAGWKLDIDPLDLL